MDERPGGPPVAVGERMDGLELERAPTPPARAASGRRRSRTPSRSSSRPPTWSGGGGTKAAPPTGCRNCHRSSSVSVRTWPPRWGGGGPVHRGRGGCASRSVDAEGRQPVGAPTPTAACIAAMLPSTSTATRSAASPPCGAAPPPALEQPAAGAAARPFDRRGGDGLGPQEEPGESLEAHVRRSSTSLSRRTASFGVCDVRHHDRPAGRGSSLMRGSGR